MTNSSGFICNLAVNISIKKPEGHIYTFYFVNMILILEILRKEEFLKKVLIEVLFSFLLIMRPNDMPPTEGRGQYIYTGEVRHDTYRT